MKKMIIDVRKTIENIVILSEYPKSGIDIVFEIIEQDGSLCPFLLNAASVCLSLAGIKLYSSFSACATVKQSIIEY